MTKNKVIVRRLPPNLPEHVFWQSVESWVTADTVAWKSFYAGKPKSRPEKPNVSSRAYIVFKTPELLVRFSREYDGHAFRDKQGNESFAVVEFAPFQKVPQERKKPDARVGTIHQDDDFKSFLESLNAVPVSDEPSTTRIDPKTTPLLEALRAEKAAAKDAAQILSYHGHYHKSKSDRLTLKASSKASKAGPAASLSLAGKNGLRKEEDDGAVFSRKLNPDGTPVVAPTAILTKPDPPSGSVKGAHPTKGRNGTGSNATGNGTSEREAAPSSTTPSKPSAAAKKRAAQAQAQAQAARGRGNSNASTMLSSPTVTPASPRPILPKAEVRNPDSGATASASSKSTTEGGGSTTPTAAGARPERKKHIANPRMFEAALAGVGGGAAGGAAARRREREAKKEKSDTPNADAPGPAAQTNVASSSAPIADATAPAPSAPEKKERPPTGPRGGAPPSGKNPHKRERGPKPGGGAGKAAPAGDGGGSETRAKAEPSTPAPPKILSRQPPTNVAAVAPAEASAPNGSATSESRDTSSATPTRGAHSGGRRGRGRGRGRGGLPGPNAGASVPSTDS